MTSDILVDTDSGNGLWPVGHQAITWTNADIVTFGTSEINFPLKKIQSECVFFFQDNEFENVCKMAAIFAGFGALYPYSLNTIHEGWFILLKQVFLTRANIHIYIYIFIIIYQH